MLWPLLLRGVGGRDQQIQTAQCGLAQSEGGRQVACWGGSERASWERV